jgi:hypothetical protein
MGTNSFNPYIVTLRISSLVMIITIENLQKYASNEEKETA